MVVGKDHGQARGKLSDAANYKGFADDSLVISVDEAERLLGRENVVFVDTRNYWKYVKGHVPGAVNLELYAFHWYDTSEDGLKLFAGQMANLFGAYGINEERDAVVFYQNNSGYDAARGVWLMNWLGANNARLLDGGLNLWRRRGLPTSSQDGEIESRRFRFGPLRRDVVCTKADLQSGQKMLRSNPAAMRVLDARSEGEYDGTFRRAFNRGHIPGAVNIEWKKALRRDGTLKSAAQLEKLYGPLSRGGDTVAYCQSGYRAAHTWLVLRLLGSKGARNYLGSWYEWGSDPALPTG